ncbi:MAG: TonB-linked outer membrane protein SusC/RagA family [Bacteroidetes bacterium]|nr:MAG: TonB-linked outer membrane protein SusC/RagA family [Bacteroidota bacterium]
MKRFFLILSIAFFLFTTSFGQSLTVKGQVKADEDGLALPGVSVHVKGTTSGTVTDIDGNFTLQNLNSNQTLVISFIGYESQEFLVGNNTQFAISLVESAKLLEEVVVTALGISRQKREIGYSTEKIEATVVTDSKASNVLNAISGRAAGVQISQPDGVEGGSSRIVIRGNNNIGSDNQPLIVVDNIPLENTPGLTNIGRGVDWGSAINDLNAYDIESMTLMKGGAASALYGSRGANGVLFITTKRGTKQKGIGITYNTDFKITTPYLFRDVQNTYGHGGPISFTPPSFPMSGDTLLYPGIYGNENLIINQQGETSSTSAEFGYYGSAVSWGPKMEGQMVKWWDGEMRTYAPQPDNLKIPFHNGFTTTHNISATGGGDKGTMRVSFTRQDNKAIVDNSNFDRTTVNLGATLKISDKLQTDVTMSFIQYNRLNSPMLGEDWSSFNKGLLYSWPRSYQGIDKENRARADGSQNPQEGYPFFYVSPTLWWDYYSNNTNQKRDKYTGALSLSYDPFDWLNILGRIGRDYTIEQFETKNKPTDPLGLLNGYYSNGLSRNKGDNYDFVVTASKDQFLGSPFDLKLTTGASRWSQDYYYINGHSGTWYYPNMYTFFNFTETTYTTDPNNNTIVDQPGNSASSMLPKEGILRKRNNSVYAFMNVSYKNSLYVELTGRNDWSSALPMGNNSYFYPSLSVSFIPTEAFEVFQNIPWMNFMKIRGGIAQTATDTDPYLLSFYYNTSLFGGQQSSGFPGIIPPIRLRPQRVNAYEAGVNMGFFENKIDLDFTYYYLYSFDQIIPNLPVPVSSGASNIMTNEGVLSNRGFELIINTVPYQTRDLVIKSGINLARNRNRVESLGGDAETYLLADIWGLNGPAMVLEAGDDYGTISGYDYIYDENGQRVVNDAGTKYLITDSRVPIGNASPDFIAGWNTSIQYKNLRFGMLIDTKWGGDIYSGSYVIGLQTGQSPETIKERDGGGLPYTDPAGNTSNIGIILEGVHEDGTPNTTVVHYYYKYLPNAGGWGKFVSTPGILENTWVKMREVTLALSIPQKWVQKTKVFQKLSISLTGRDLFYIYKTLPDNINPEGIMGSGNAQGFEWAANPGTRSFIMSLSAGF